MWSAVIEQLLNSEKLMSEQDFATLRAALK